MKKQPLIGIIAPVLARDYLTDILRGALKQAALCGCDAAVLAPLVHFTASDPRHAACESEIFRLILSPEFDGFLYIKDDTVMGSEAIALVEQYLMQSNQYVMTVDEQEHPVFDTTQHDDYYDFCTVIAHLIEVHGFRRIYCLTGPRNVMQAESRLRAYKDMMDKYGLYYDETYYSYGTFWVDSAKAFAARLISGGLPMPEAVACGNDVTAMSLIKCLQGAGIRVPEDIAVTGYDGFPFSANIDVTLTTYARNHEQLGADAVRRLFRNITGTLSPKLSRLEDGFLVGSSCGCKTVPVRQLMRGFSANKPRMWLEEVFADNMAPDIAQAESVDDLLRRAVSHTNVLYQLARLQVALAAPEQPDQAAGGPMLQRAMCCGADCVPEPFDPAPFSAMQVSEFLKGQQAPRAVFLSPLHLNAEKFGMIALSFSETGAVYDQRYLQFVSTLSLGLERLMHRTASRPDDTEREEPVQKIRNAEVCGRIQALRQKMEAEPERRWTIEEMCRSINISKSALQKNYRSIFGGSIFEDLIGFRIKKAKTMLLQSSLSVSEISEQCGYSSESYFMKQFKKETGLTPSEFRNRK